MGLERYIPRDAGLTLKRLVSNFRAVVVMGPRQSGKTTLVRNYFSDKPYVSLEQPDQRRFAQDDPKGFIYQYAKGAIFDEIQRVPELFSWLQGAIDNSEERGRFILTGSNNLLMMDAVTQTLAGRVGHLELLPLTLSELYRAPGFKGELNHNIIRGFYPEPANAKLDSKMWLDSYIRTYLERDVRQLTNIKNFATFEKFLLLCAGRVGQLLNASSMAVEVGVDAKTINAWLSILEASYIIFRLRPYHNNFNKRIVKSPKLYFVDTGVCANLLGVHSASVLKSHPLRGALFENIVVADLLKHKLQQGHRSNLYFWRDKRGSEIDIIVDGSPLQAIEVKSGETVTSDFFKHLHTFSSVVNKPIDKQVIYGGNTYQKRSDGTEVLPWMALAELE